MSKDRWAEWLASRRDGGDVAARRRGLQELAVWRDRVLDNAGLSEGETLLDVGCGEGLIGFGALERGAGEVVFSDISQELLDFCHGAAVELGVVDRCRFVRAGADDLAPIESESVDIVTTRSVLIYVDDKGSALSEFHRVLRSGGRLSLYEPINRFTRRNANTSAGYDLAPISDIARKIRDVYESSQPSDFNPMLTFDERDLIDHAEQAGFFPIHLDFEARLTPLEPREWEGFINSSGNPLIPTAAEAMEQALTPDERERFTRHLRPLVEAGRGVSRMAAAYLHAVKP